MNLQKGEPSSHRVLSYADDIAVFWQDFLLLVGRVMIGWTFLQSGWGKLFNIAGVGKTFPQRGLPEWMAYISVPTEFFGGPLSSSWLCNAIYGTRHVDIYNRCYYQFARLLELSRGTAHKSGNPLLEERLNHGRIHRFVCKGRGAFQLRQLAEQEALTRG